MGEIHQPHDAEDEAESRCEERIETAEQDALNESVEPDHRRAPSTTLLRKAGEGRHIGSMVMPLPEIGRVDLFSRDVRRPGRQCHAASHHAVDAVGDSQSLADVLLDEDDGGAVGEDLRQGGVDVTDDDGCEAEADLVAEQQFGVRHQSAADGHHLLLAAGEGRATAAAAFAQDREEFVDRVERPMSRRLARLSADLEIFFHAEARERADAPPAPWRCRASSRPPTTGRRSARPGGGPCRARCGSGP